MAQIYFAILTAIGEAKLANATALGTTLQLTKMAVGDGNGATPIPNRTQTALVHENRRAPLNTLFVDPANASQIVAEQIIPEDIGGWWIRELGLYDAAGDLCAVANCPDTYKPVLASGSGRTQIIRMVLIVANTSAVELKIDPSVVLATRGHVDQTMAAHATATDPHPQYATDADLAAHNAAADPHPQYLTSAEGDAKVAAAVAALVASSPASLDTLDELAAALGDDPNFATTIINALAGKAAKATTLAGYGILDALTHIASGQPLPAQNIGPIWHDDYNGLLTWQVFNSNGASYTGYASVLVGSLLLDTQSTTRAGYVKSGVQNLSKTAYAALRAWAMHNGILVAVGAWQAGQIVCADNADGTTFRVYDVRGEFLRAWDDARGADPSRAFGTWQNGTHITGDTGTAPATHGIGNLSQCNVDPSDGGVRDLYYVGTGVTAVSDTAFWGRVRPRNTALLASIKF